MRGFIEYSETVCVAQNGGSKAYLVRDRYAANHSNFCIAYCARKSGGTANTVRYTHQQGVVVYSIANTE